jgi:hypothetical protein
MFYVSGSIHYGFTASGASWIAYIVLIRRATASSSSLHAVGPTDRQAGEGNVFFNSSEKGGWEN